MLMAFIYLALTVIAVFILLVGSELWWRGHAPKGEFSRKFIHITVGSFAAFWPFYLSWTSILLLSAAFVVVVLASKYFHVFQAIHTVQRPTYGEICFALAVGALAIITHNNWIYAAALLHMSLADGLAAIIGTKYGASTTYRVLGHDKSIAGSATFLVVSLLILYGFTLFASPLAIGIVIALALSATAIENVGIYGLDNLMVPLLIGIVLEHVV